MTYYTHIPDTTYAQRQQRFLAVRAEARRSLSNCQALHDTWQRVCDAKLSRNFVDAPEIARAGQQIVKISKMMRDLRPLALQPDPPRHEPVTERFVSVEARTYGGVKASRLVRVLRFIGRLRRSGGEKRAAQRVMNMSDKLINGLDVYKRVKALISNLLEAVDAPEIAPTTTMQRRARPATEHAQPRTAFTWEVSPQKLYGWRQITTTKGYDARQTSVYWLETQSTALKRAVYREYHGIKPAPAKPRLKPSSRKIETRIYTPPQGAERTDEIWPPIDLVRLIEERRAHTTCEEEKRGTMVRAMPDPAASTVFNAQNLREGHIRYEIPRPDE